MVRFAQDKVKTENWELKSKVSAMHFYFINLMRSIPYFSLFSFPFSVCYQCVQKELSCPKGQLYSYLIGPNPMRYYRNPEGVRLVVLECCLVWYSQLLATLSATSSQYLTAIGSSHSLTETMLVDSLTTRRLVSSLHCHSCICFLLFCSAFLSLSIQVLNASFARCKGTTIFCNCKQILKNISLFGLMSAKIATFYSSKRFSSPCSTLP